MSNDSKARTRTVSTKRVEKARQKLGLSTPDFLAKMQGYASNHPEMDFQECLTAFTNEVVPKSTGGSNSDPYRDAIKNIVNDGVEGTVVSVRASSKTPNLYNVSLDVGLEKKQRAWAKVDTEENVITYGIAKATIGSVPIPASATVNPATLVKATENVESNSDSEVMSETISDSNSFL